MPVVLNDKVGIGCINLQPDVVQIQDALNRVPLDQGGTPPNKKLPVNGNCGPQTIEAIQLFQLKQFGWPGADGKIFPNGQTHTRLNQILGTTSPSIPGFPEIPEPVTNAFLIRFLTGSSKNYVDMLYDVHLQIEDAANGGTANYVISLLGRIGVPPGAWKPDPYSEPEALHWDGNPMSVNEFDGFAFRLHTVSLPGFAELLLGNPGLPTAFENNTMSLKAPDSDTIHYLNRKVGIWEAHWEAWQERRPATKSFTGRMNRVYIDPVLL